MKMLPLLEDLAVSAVAGYAGTKAMEPVSMKLYEMESTADREREDAVRPGPPYEIAARKIAALAGVTLEGKALDRASLAAHYGLALSWSPLYLLLRRRTSLRPITAGLTTGAAMSAIADEWMTPAFGFSAPNRAYPLSTHLRGVAAHLVFGLGSPTAPKLCGQPGDAGHDVRWATSQTPPLVNTRDALSPPDAAGRMQNLGSDVETLSIRTRVASGVAVVLIAAAALGWLLDTGRLSGVVVSLFVLPASAAQALSVVLLSQQRSGSVRRVRLAIVLNVAGGVAWLVLRTVVDPTQPRAGPVAAVPTTTQLLSAAALAATVLLFTQARWTVPVSRNDQRRLAAALSASWVLTLALTTSLVAVYIPNITIEGQSPVLALRFTPEPWPGGPAVETVITGHLQLVLNTATAAFVVLSAGLLALLVRTRLEAASRQVACRTGRPSRGALAAAVMTAPGCCAVPLTALLGPAALTAVAATTPYLMLAVVLVLAADVVRLKRLLSRPPGADPKYRGLPAAAPGTHSTLAKGVLRDAQRNAVEPAACFALATDRAVTRGSDVNI